MFWPSSAATSTTGAITTTARAAQVYMADDSMFFAAGGTPDGEGDFDAAWCLALAPVATGGSITINGPVNTGLFRAAAGTGLTTQAITADEIEAQRRGTATINGIWTAPLVTLASNDINITANGGIAAGAGGEINLLSTNADASADRRRPDRHRLCSVQCRVRPHQRWRHQHHRRGAFSAAAATC